MFQHARFLAFSTERCRCIDEHRFVEVRQADSLNGLLQDTNGILKTLSIAQDDRFSYSSDILIDTYFRKSDGSTGDVWMSGERAQCCCRFPYVTELTCFEPELTARLPAQAPWVPSLIASVDCRGYFLPVILRCVLMRTSPALVTSPFWLPIRSGGKLFLQALEGGGVGGLLVERRPCRMVLLYQTELLCIFYGTAGLIDAAAAVLGD